MDIFDKIIAPNDAVADDERRVMVTEARALTAAEIEQDEKDYLARAVHVPFYNEHGELDISPTEEIEIKGMGLTIAEYRFMIEARDVLDELRESGATE
jgi:hypothetical protein